MYLLVVNNNPSYRASAIAFAVWGILTAATGTGVLLGYRIARPVAGVLAGLAALFFSIGLNDGGNALDYVTVAVVMGAGTVAVLALGYGRIIGELAGTL